MQGRKRIEVVAALIRRGDRFLICRRPPGKACALLWEFAGGKVEPGECKAQALVRECREELKVDIAVQDVIGETAYDYPEVTVQLTLFEATIVRGEICRMEHSDLRWITAEEIAQYEFCPADQALLLEIQRRDGAQEKSAAVRAPKAP